MLLTKNEFDFLNSIYSNIENEAAFTSSVSLLLKAANKKFGGDKVFSYDQVEEFLNSLDTHTLFKHEPSIYKKRNFRPFLVGSINEQWQADLADMSRHKLINSPSFLLCVIDVFSKYAFVRGLPSKHGSIVSNAFKSIFNEATSHPEFICTDFGKEFINHNVKQTLQSFGVQKIFQTTGNNKAAVVERFISSLRMIITKFLFHHHFTTLNESHIQMIVKQYNHRNHSSIGQRPVDVWNSKQFKKNHQCTILDNQSMQIKHSGHDPSLMLDVFQSIKDNIQRRIKKSRVIKFQSGDFVRISNFKKTFQSRINNPRFSLEKFKISKVHLPMHDHDVISYSIQGFNTKLKKWEQIHGKFYQHELIHSINTS